MGCEEGRGLRSWGLFLLLTVCLFSMFLGPVFINPFSVNNESLGLIIDFRLPRVLLAAVNGALLSVSGAIFQVVLRNPLADGFTTGVASSCALGAVLAISFGLPMILVAGVSAAFGIVGFLFVYLLASYDGAFDPITLILAGIVLNVVASSLISLLKFLFEDSILSVVFWLMGGIPILNWSRLFLVFLAFFVCFLILLRKGYALNLLSLDDASAVTAGVDVAALRRKSFFAATVMTAFSVSFCGIIAFVGLIVPHMVRAIFGADVRDVLYSSALWGASFLVVADTLSRTLLVGGAELPVGVLTSAMGGLFFLYLMMKRKWEGWRV